MEGFRYLPIGEAVRNIDVVVFHHIADKEAFTAMVGIFAENAFGGLDAELVVSVVKHHDGITAKPLILEFLLFRLETGVDLETPTAVRAGNVQTRHFRGVAGNPLPVVPVPLTTESVAIAPKVAHFVEENIPIFIFPDKVVFRYLDGKISVTRGKLPKLVVVVGDDEIHLVVGGAVPVKDGGIEIVVPIFQLGDGNSHIPFVYITKIGIFYLWCWWWAQPGQPTLRRNEREPFSASSVPLGAAQPYARTLVPVGPFWAARSPSTCPRVF